MPKLTRGSFALPGTTLGYHTGTWRTQKPRYTRVAAPCHGVCPAGEDPQAYIAELDAGNTRAAWEKLVEANPLPAITGRVCPHPCEGECNRGHLDEAVAIHNIERYLGDEAIAHGWPYPVSLPPTTAARVAIVGAGPAGISAAYHLLRLGLRPTVFSAVPEAGGTLHAIPGYRLPKDVISNEITRVLNSGIEFRPSQRLGRDYYIEDLQREYDAVFLGPGTQQSRDWNVEGVVPRDLHQGLHLLKEWMAVGTVPTMHSAAVVGGGNTAVDVARILKRAGVGKVYIVTHNGLPGPDAIPGDVMRAIPREIEQAMEEGVEIHAHQGIRRLILRGEQVSGIETTSMKKLPDASGRLRRVAFEGTESILHVDQVIPAIGQVVNPAGMERLLNGGSYLTVDHWGRIAGHDRLFAGGDARSGSDGTVTAAVGDGRRAALAIHATLNSQDMPEVAENNVLPYSGLNLAYFESSPRNEGVLLPVEQRTCEEEIEGVISHGQANAEARRCLSCGSCMTCDNCWTLCPDSAVLKTPKVLPDGGHYVFDYDYCKGCGLCAHECPTGYIQLQDEL